MTFSRILHVELRKSVDTRAARWLLVVSVALSVCALAINSFTEVDNFADFLRGATLPMPALLPIVAILASTSDWSQRSAMTTFVLVPRRSHGRLASRHRGGCRAGTDIPPPLRCHSDHTRVDQTVASRGKVTESCQAAGCEPELRFRGANDEFGDGPVVDFRSARGLHTESVDEGHDAQSGR
ncbi:MAG: hypothetical protein JWP75_3281 [Frondihabitans sp.]|nr:hypothetical protein [Frondihabitans sp.]